MRGGIAEEGNIQICKIICYTNLREFGASCEFIFDILVIKVSLPRNVRLNYGDLSTPTHLLNLLGIETTQGLMYPYLNQLLLNDEDHY